jgi:hypothetical protein
MGHSAGEAAQALTGNSIKSLPGYDPRPRAELGQWEGMKRSAGQVLAAPVGIANTLVGGAAALAARATRWLRPSTSSDRSSTRASQRKTIRRRCTTPPRVTSIWRCLCNAAEGRNAARYHRAATAGTARSLGQHGCGRRVRHAPVARAGNRRPRHHPLRGHGRARSLRQADAGSRCSGFFNQQFE